MTVKFKKKLTYEERAVFGTCPICAAAEGEVCRPEAGILLDAELGPGAHVARLLAAPKQITTLNEAPQE